MNETQRGVRDDTLLSSRKGSRVMTVDKNKYILSINGMSKSFGRNKVLKHISLNVKPIRRQRSKFLGTKRCTGKRSSDGTPGIEPMS